MYTDDTIGDLHLKLESQLVEKLKKGEDYICDDEYEASYIASLMIDSMNHAEITYARQDGKIVIGAKQLVSEDEANDMISKHCDEQGITMEKFFDERETEDKVNEIELSNSTISIEDILSNGISEILKNYDVKVKS